VGPASSDDRRSGRDTNEIENEVQTMGEGKPTPFEGGAEEALEVGVERGAADGEVVVSVAGELDPHTAPRVKEAIDTALEEGTTRLVVDLSRVTFIDSSGLRVIIGGHQRSESAGGAFVLRNPSEATARLLEITGLDQHLAIDAVARPGAAR
jgi:anti-anti-sigma factor